MTACNAVEPGHHDFPARCALTPGHDGPHRAAEGIVAMVRIDPDVEWGHVDDQDPAVAVWRRIFRRTA